MGRRKHHQKRPKAEKPGFFTLTRKEKTVIHLVLLVLVIMALLHEGGGHADWAFLILAIGVELT